MDEAAFAAARRASGLTAEQAARAAGVSRPTLGARERDPGSFRLDELRGLYAELTPLGRQLLRHAVASAWEDGVGGSKDNQG